MQATPDTPTAGLQGSRRRVSVTKTPSGLWKCAVALPSGEAIATEYPSQDSAWEAYDDLYQTLIGLQREEAA